MAHPSAFKHIYAGQSLLLEGMHLPSVIAQASDAVCELNNDGWWFGCKM